ncbi:MAG: hypothetical protein SOW59_03295, partial [Corynebacterium sp.]|nr:hypothetical protein [Corynebacterium sp.]
DIVGNLLDEDVHIGHQCLPIAGMLSDDGTRKLFQLSAAEARDGEDISSIVADFHSRVFFPLAGYDVPMIRLARETARAGIGSIFAQANAAGVHMDVFDLLTAVFSLEDENFHLANDWARVEKHLRKYPALDGIGRTQFLSAVSLYSTVNKGHAGGQREDILTLTLPEYQASVEKLRITFQEVAEFLKQRCIYTVEQVPYSAQIIPLAIILARLTDVPGALSAKQAWEKLDRWFWSGIFGELYGADSVKLRSARDVVEVVDWVLGDRSEEPKTVGEAVFYESRLHSAPDDSALLNAVYALLMSQGAKDWRTAQSFNQQSFKALGTGFHFIFPPAWCKRHQVSSDAAQSVVNRTPMGKKTEVLIEDSSPRRYLTRVQSKSLMEDTDFDVTLASHQLDPELLWKADFAAFTADRSRRLAAMIEQAMGKKVEPISKK